MRVWQATWDGSKQELVLWAEGKSKSDASGHPYALRGEQLLSDIAVWELEAEIREIELELPTIAEGPCLSPKLAASESPDEPRVETWKTPAIALKPLEAFFFLSTTPERLPEGMIFDHSVLFWREATKFLLDLLTRGRFLPNISREGTRFLARWLPVVNLENDTERLQVLTTSIPKICLSLKTTKLTGAASARAELEQFLSCGCDELIRLFLKRFSFESVTAQTRSAAVSRWVTSLIGTEPAVQAPLHELLRLEERLRAWTRSVLAPTALEALRVGFRIHVPPLPESGLPEQWTIELLLCAEVDSVRHISAEQLWSNELGFLENSEYSQEDLENIFLQDLGRALSAFPLVERCLSEPFPTGIELSTSEAYEFLRDSAVQLEGLGFPVFLPAWWRKPTTKLGLKLTIDSDDVKMQPHTRNPFLATNQLLDFSFQVALGDKDLSREDFEALVKQKMPLIRVQGQWVELDPRRAEATLAFLRGQESRKKISFLEALHLGYGLDDEENILPLVGLSARGWVNKLLYAENSNIEMLEDPPGFFGSLRPYQREGLSWLAFRLQLGIGGCLADDMGLGKTIQLLVLMLFERQRRLEAQSPDAHFPFLLIVPMSILANWEAEIQKFAPELQFYIHHGSQRWMQEAFFERVKKVDLVITTYSLAFRDEDMLSVVSWGGFALDEAQNIKNLETKQTQAIRRLCHTQLRMAEGTRTFHRIALTGTPLENHLQELWSIFDFLNPGLLGSLQEFKTRYAVPIERFRSKDAAASLSRLLKPFVLRRLKSDPAVLNDLPEKIEMQELVPLSNEQALLYQAALDEMLPQVEAARGMHRKGLVLSTITRLKQICNHPALFLKDGNGISGRSHKVARLEQLLEEIVAEGDKALIFTQFAQFGHLLQPYLQERLDREVIFLHGALPRAAREKVVQRFQQPDGPSIFLLSLKAGGFGLNLTQANQVIHVDQWWNPAVEDQATDRAYRIGQKRNVQVRKLVCQGTLEERISQMLQQKRELAEQIVGATRDSITQLSTDELRKLLELAPVARRGTNVEAEEF